MWWMVSTTSVVKWSKEFGVISSEIVLTRNHLFKSFFGEYLDS